MRLTEFAIRNFRSVGPNWVSLAPVKSCNVIVGPNNAGKSNILQALGLVIDALRPEGRLAIEANDHHKRDLENRFEFKIGFRISAHEYASSLGITSIWFRGLARGNRGVSLVESSLEDIDLALLSKFERKYLGEYHPESRPRETHNELLRKHYDEFLKRYLSPHLPSIGRVPVFRQIRPGSDYQHNGQGLFERLREMQNPGIANSDLKARFAAIVDTTRHLMREETAEVEVLHDSSDIAITIDGLRLPLQSYGTGLHQLVIMAAAILSEENSVFLIEEPEIHLHPRLQRDFLEFLVRTESTQTFITTHASPLISPSENVAIFALRSKDRQTCCENVVTGPHLREALHDLGQKASDVLQSNCAIWVEGPSDRIYLRKWIQLCDDELVEGKHYSIMYYGGKLLSHLCFEDDVPDENLIEMLKLNHRAIVVVDRDTDGPSKQIRATKQRVKSECERSNSIFWVTSGREIENYLTVPVIMRSYEEAGFSINPRKIKLEKYARLSDSLGCAVPSVAGARYDNDKVGWARRFAAQMTADDISEAGLRRNLNRVCQAIRQWNE